LKRKAVILDKSSHGTVVICVDLGCASEILPYVFEVKAAEEFGQIRELLKTNTRNKEKYCNCSESASNMYEMRFTRFGRNDRIYCQEVHKSSIRYVIMCELFVGKKSNDIPKKFKGRITTMGDYEFEIV